VEVYIYEEVKPFEQVEVSKFKASQEDSAFHIMPVDGEETFNILEDKYWDNLKGIVQAYIAGMKKELPLHQWLFFKESETL
jgi:hypothetical protein